ANPSGARGFSQEVRQPPVGPGRGIARFTHVRRPTTRGGDMFRRTHFAIVVLLTVLATLMLSNNAMAYVGPGGGMEFFGYALSLIAMLGAAFLSVVLWPFHKVMGWLRGSKGHATAEQSTAPNSVADPSPSP